MESRSRRTNRNEGFDDLHWGSKGWEKEIQCTTPAYGARPLRFLSGLFAPPWHGIILGVCFFTLESFWGVFFYSGVICFIGRICFGWDQRDMEGEIRALEADLDIFY